MRYYADECLDRQIVSSLRAAGADVTEAAALAKGAADADVLASGSADDRVILTEDKGFGALVYRDGRASAGVVLIRMDRIDAAAADLLAARILALPEHGRGAFTTIDADGERKRPLRS